MDNISGIAFSTFLMHSIPVSGLSVRVVMRRRLVAVLLAWMAIILVTRAELRNHRKLSVIDGEVAWSGSQNLVDRISSNRTRTRDSGPMPCFVSRARSWRCLAGVYVNDMEIATGVSVPLNSDLSRTWFTCLPRCRSATA
jgi:phosphatidylserine/phosphatidylglycerophosphate/cardiolipin synthase-like enzyme